METTTQTKPKKRKGPDSCNCEGVPTLASFTLPTIKGDAVLSGTYCSVCYHILAWGKVQKEEETLQKPITTEQATETLKKERKPRKTKQEDIPVTVVESIPNIPAGYAKTEDQPALTNLGTSPEWPVMHETPKPVEDMTPKEISEAVKDANQEEAPTYEQVKAEVQAETREKLAEAFPESDLEIIKTALFPIIGVNPVKDEPSKMSFLCAYNGFPFNVIVQSTEDKVKRNINSPNIVVGKMAELEYSRTEKTGVPVNPKILAVKPKVIVEVIEK